MTSLNVAVVVPNVGQTKFLQCCLKSLLAQTATYWECIVVTNDPAAVTLVDRLDDRRIRALLFSGDLGVSRARNVGIRNTSSPMIMCLDADDLVSKHYIMRAASLLLQNSSNVRVVNCRARLFGERRGEFDLPPYSLDVLRRRNLICTPALFTRSDFERVGGFDEHLRTLEDWEFWIALLRDGASVSQLITFDYYYRQHPESHTSHRTVGDWFDAREYIRWKHRGFFTAELRTTP